MNMMIDAIFQFHQTNEMTKSELGRLFMSQMKTPDSQLCQYCMS